MLFLLPGWKSGISRAWVIVPLVFLVIFFIGAITLTWIVAGTGAALAVLSAVLIVRADLAALRRTPPSSGF